MPKATPLPIRRLIIEKHNAGFSQKVIATHLNLPTSTFNDILKKYAATGDIIPGTSTNSKARILSPQNRNYVAPYTQLCVPRSVYPHQH